MWSDIAAGIAQQGGATWEIGLGLIGRAVAQGDYDKANAIYQTVLESISAEEVPQFQKMVAQEIPEATRIMGAGEGRQAQSSALQRLQSFVDQHGLDAQARAAQSQALTAADQRAQGDRQALQSQFARRGMGGSASELSAQMSANQNAANQARQSSLDIAGQARQRALQALGQQAQIGGQMRGQDIDVESKNMAAEQARNEFNAKMRYASMGANNDYMQQDFRNRMAKQNAMNDARYKMAGQHEKGARRTQADYSSVGKAINYKHQAAAEDLEDMNF